MRLTGKGFSNVMYLLYILAMSCLLAYQIGQDAAHRDARIKAESAYMPCSD